MKKTTMIVAMMAGLALSASAGLLEYFEMDDTAGTAMNALSNTGSLGSQWNFGGAGMATDGSGSFVLAGDGGSTTRKLPKKGTLNANAAADTYATPLAGSDTYSLELNLSAWDMTNAAINDSMNFKALDSAGVMVALVTLQKDSATTVRLRMASGNANYRNYAFGLTGVVATLKVDFNLAAGTSEYFLDGASVNTFSGLTLNGDIGGLIFTKSGGWADATSSVSVDSMGLSVIPEPATLGVIGFFGSAIIFIRRRFTI